MLSSHFQPVEIDNHKFDKGMILYEFDALREPERTQFPQIGEWVKSRIPMNQIPTPQMYWRGKYWPDLYIANQLDAVAEIDLDCGASNLLPTDTAKADWPDDYDLWQASNIRHGKAFHDTFIEPMCRKITGRSTSEIAAKYHRAIWLPLYWPQTLRERQSIPTPFWYPKAGYAGAIGTREASERVRNDGRFDWTDISITFVLAKTRSSQQFAVLFVVDDSPIYRITDMDACAGIEAEWHRWVVESCGNPFDITDFCSEIQWLDSMQINMPLPTIANVKAGWKPKPHMNAQLLEAMNELQSR